MLKDMSRTIERIQKEEPGRSEKEAAWQTAIGLQAAESLRTSDYLLQTAQKHIDGKISLDNVQEQIEGYHFERNEHDAGDPEKEEADKVAVNITRILLTQAVDLSANGLSRLHRKIFEGVYENAGILREEDVSKREWVLGGEPLKFISFENLQEALENCLAKESRHNYKEDSSDELVSHLSEFISKIWHINAFGEGNTRFTAVFTLLYLHHLGISIKSDTFKNESWYFHNALVRANFRDIQKNIDYEPVYLERFFRNMLLGEQWDLRNRYLHVRPAAEWRTQGNLNPEASTGQVQIKQSASRIKEKAELKISKEEAQPAITAPKAEIKPLHLSEKAENLQNSAENPNILFLAVAIGDEFLSVKEIMDRLKLKGRDNFTKLYLSPALSSGVLALLYPNSPRHPRQKYLLTQKGLDLLNETSPEMRARIERHLANSRA